MKRRPKTTAIITAGITAGLLTAVMTPGVATADEIRDGQWYLDTLGIHEAHELSQGAGVTIGVIDTGIDAEHPDLEGQVLPGTDLVYDDRDGLTDDFGHGTSVASVLVGDNDADGILGIAPEATVLSVNIFKDDSPVSNPKLIAPAIEWLIDNGADIINISVGGGGDAASQEAINRATDNGIPIVASAGNRYQDIGFGEYERSGTSNPAAQSGAIPVTASTPDGVFFDDSLDLSTASRQPQLGLSAPGLDIPVAMPNNGYDTANGTSFSAPIVAGALALIKSAYPDLDYNQWIDRLLDTVDDKGDEGYDYEYGWGIVNPLAALTEETVYEGASGDQVSSPDDRLPLEEQGQQTGDDGEAPGDNGDDPAETDDDQALTATTAGLPLWVWITIAATAILTAAVITTLLLRRRNRSAPTSAISASVSAETSLLKAGSPMPPTGAGHYQHPPGNLSPPQPAQPPTGQEVRPPDHQ